MAGKLWTNKRVDNIIRFNGNNRPKRFSTAHMAVLYVHTSNYPNEGSLCLFG